MTAAGTRTRNCGILVRSAGAANELEKPASASQVLFCNKSSATLSLNIDDEQTRTPTPSNGAVTLLRRPTHLPSPEMPDIAQLQHSRDGDTLRSSTIKGSPSPISSNNSMANLELDADVTKLSSIAHSPTQMDPSISYFIAHSVQSLRSGKRQFSTGEDNVAPDSALTNDERHSSEQKPFDNRVQPLPQPHSITPVIRKSTSSMSLENGGAATAKRKISPSAAVAHDAAKAVNCCYSMTATFLALCSRCGRNNQRCKFCICGICFAILIALAALVLLILWLTGEKYASNPQ